MTESNVTQIKGGEQAAEAPVGASSEPVEEESNATPEGPTTQQEAVKRAYSAATTALRENHREEFHKDVAARVKEFGFDWKPKPTKAEKALAEARRLLSEAGLSKADL